MNRKLNVLLGLREKVESSFKNMLDDLFKKFKNNQGLFLGYRKTYQPIDEYADDPSKRGFVNVQSTVAEQLDYMRVHTMNFMDIVFSIEKTNATGRVKAPLIVENENWGEYTSLELLRLKTTLDNSKLRGLYKEIPVRSDTEIWVKASEQLFAERDIWMNSINEGQAKTTIKESYILEDPHAERAGRQPVIAEKTTQVNIGNYTSQMFTGAITLTQRAKMQRRYDTLYAAVIEALEIANNVEAETSDLGTKIFTYLHG